MPGVRLFDPEDRLWLMALFIELKGLGAGTVSMQEHQRRDGLWSPVSSNLPRIHSYLDSLLRGPHSHLGQLLSAAEFRSASTNHDRPLGAFDTTTCRVLLDVYHWEIIMTNRFGARDTYNLKGGPDEGGATTL